MKTHSRKPVPALATVAIAGLALAVTPATAQTNRYWTGTGTWNTSTPAWATTPGGPYNTAWVGDDNATFEGTAATVTLGEAIGVTNITFAAGSLGTSQYTIAGNTLDISAGGTISNLNGTSGKIQTITSAITGSPNVNQITSSSGGDVIGGIKFAPTGGAVQHLGTVTLAAGYPGSSGGADKTTLWLSGTTTGNAVHTVNQNTNYSLIRKSDSGSWTLTGVAKFGRFYMDGGDLIVTGTLQSTQYQGFFLNSGTLHYNSPGAVRNTPDVGQALGFNGGALDNTSGAAITSSTYDPLMKWNANVTFIGSNGAASDLDLGNGAVTLVGSRTVTVQDAATTLAIGGVISSSATSDGLTKAGPGTLALNGVNSYTGPTILNQGTLRVDGSIDSASTVTVNGGALAGTGMIHGTVNVPSGNTLSISNADGPLNLGNVVVDGTLSFGIGDVEQETDGTLAVTGDLDITGATLNLNITAGTVQTEYIIATYGSLTGTFATVNGLPADWAVAYAHNTGNAIAIVPPTPVAPPSQPAGLTATDAVSADGSTSFVKLDWNAASGAASYIVKRATNSSGPYTPIATTKFRTYNDADVTIGQTYHYVVSAENLFAEGADSLPASATPVAPPPPPAPSGLVATTLNGLTSLTWNPTPATSGYIILRATVSGGPYEEIATTTTNSYPVSSGVIGTTYHYVVAATNSGGTSGSSNEASSLFAGDPLIVAADQIKSHITGTPALTTAELEQASLALQAQTNRFAESVDTISAVFDLVSTYDGVKGPLFVATGSLARASQANDLTWTIYRTMQSIMDVVYQPGTLADAAKLDVIENFNNPGGFKFGSSASFPGPCAPPADPDASHTVAIQGSFDDTFGRNTQGWTLPARKPTGCYLAPGTSATVTVPPSLVNTGYQVRVGAHSWDLSNRPEIRRLDRATLLYPINATTVKVASPYGGGIYIEVPIGASAGVVDVTITGAVRSPYFSAKSFHQTTPAEWLVERAHAAPWADFQSDRFMTQVPSKWIYAHPDPAQMMADWDAAMDAINDLMGFPHIRGKETMYPQVDIIMRSSVHAPGYPAVNVTDNPNNDRGGYFNNYLVRGPGASPTASHIEFHEQGHAYGFPKFGGESESNVNLLQPAMLQRKFGYSFDVAHAASLGSGSAARTVDNTAVAWMCVFNFSPREVPMATGEKAYQHKGHAKFMDVARLFGWEGLDAYWRSFMLDDANGISYGTGTDDLLLRLSRHVGRDIRPLFHFWGIHPQNPPALAAAITAESIPASPEIRDLLLHYKTLVPADNAAFRTFALAWWGKQPSINGYWEEREHARQWDTTALYGAGDQQRSEATNPGEIYNGNSASDITARIDELVALYFPGTITPDPMGFAVAPFPVDSTTISMTALTASATTGPVEYYFENTTNGNFRGWSTDTNWSNSGLSIGVPYNFRVKARDGELNETAWSAEVTATISAPDTTAPSPDPMTFASAPAATGESTITMTATNATDPSGVEYYFECTAGGGNNSGWQDSPVYTDAGLTPGTEYTYRVRARDKSPTQTATDWSGTASATTDLPDTTAPTPDPMTFASVPTAVGPNAITMTATTATDPSGVEYDFECTAGGGNGSDWQDSPVYTDTGLDPETEYTYRVRARDKSAAQTATAWSAAVSATTTVSSPQTLYRNAAGAPISWDTSATVWGIVSGGPYNTAVWSGGDHAVFEGTPGTVTPTSAITLGDLTFAPTSGGYTISGNTLHFTPGATIRNNDNRYNQTITSAITGSPAVETKDFGAGNTYLGLVFAPAGGTQTLGAVLNPNNTGATDKAGITLAGSTAGNSVVSISYAGSDRYADTNLQAGEWTIPGGIQTGTVKVTGGTFTLGGTVRTDYNEMRVTGGKVTGQFTIFTNDKRGAPYFASGSTVAPGNGIGTITVDWGTSGTPAAGSDDYAFSLRTGSTYEWQVGAGNATDTIHLTEGRLYLQNFTLNIIDAGGTPSATDQLPVFTYDAGVDVTGATLGGVTIDTSSLVGWSGTPTLGHDTTNRVIYLTGLVGPSGPGPVDHFVISAISSPRTVGTPITGITITAEDASNNTATGFTGTVTFGGTGGFSGTSTNFVAGELTGASVTPTVAGSNLTLTVDDGETHTGSTAITTIHTQYEGWAGGAAFSADANGDGVDNGVAWLLGAANPNVDATGLLPTVSESSGNLVLTFSCLNAANRGGAVLTVQHSSDLGLSDAWTSAAVPETDSVGPINGVSFAVTPGSPLNVVVATVQASEAPAGKLFARLRVVASQP